MPVFDENPIIELGKVPIPGAAPCGAEVSEDEQFIELDAEMTKVGRIEADEPDWFLMEQHAINLLRSKCKDFEVGSALGHALFQRYTYAGLSAWLAMTTEMVKNFWDGSFPTRIKRRKARIETLPDQFPDGGWFRDHPPKPDDFDAIDKAVERLEELDAAIKEKHPDDPGDFAKFKRGLKEQAAKRPAPQAAAPAPVAASEGGSGAPPAASAGSFSAGEVGDVSGALNAILAASTFLKKADPTDPTPYSVVRIMKWSKISLPTSEAAKFQIPPPEGSTVDAMAHQMGGGIWENLLKNAEGAFRSNDPLWLDLQRYVCAAMSGLGQPYEYARQAVMGLTATLVRRLGDGLFELTFSNGTPLCSGDTKMWIDSEVAPAQGGGGSGGSGDNGQLKESAAKAKKLAGAGKLKEAIAELSEGLRSSTQRRDRFLWRLCIARLCFDAKRLQLAASLLEECHEEIRRHQIDEWEPTLAVDVAQTLYRCRKQITSAEKAPAKEALQGVRDSYAWLCQLDPLAALAAEPSGK